MHLFYKLKEKVFTGNSFRFVCFANMKTIINGVVTQEGNTSDMVYNVYKSVSYISTITELEKGDIILTGTPSGVENNIVIKHSVDIFIKKV